jgi:hypothetical protein
MLVGQVLEIRPDALCPSLLRLTFPLGARDLFTALVAGVRKLSGIERNRITSL